MSNQIENSKCPILTYGGRSFFLSSTVPTLIGRQGCAILLNEEGISNRHAVVTPARGGVTLESIEGPVYVNTQIITGSVLLKSGDQIQIGPVFLSYEGPISSEVLSPIKMTPEELYEKMRPSILCIHTPTGIGSGFFIKNDGLIVTNRHVIEYEKEVEIQASNGNKWMGKVIRSFPEIDLAFIRIAITTSESLDLANTIDIRVGQPVLVIGHPLGLSNTLTRGIVSALNREIHGNVYIQTDAAINPGNSGGPVLNEYGEVLGIATFTLQNGQGLNFAIPAETIRQRLNRVLIDENRLQAGHGVYCPICGGLSRGGSFCPNCGVRFETKTKMDKPDYKNCSKCGKLLDPSDRFCSVCGSST